MFDGHEVQLHLRIRGRVEHSRSSAIRIDGIGAGARRPLLGWEYTVHDDMIHLCDIAFTIVMLHDHAADLEVRGQDHPFEGESVITRKRSVRAVPILRLPFGRLAMAEAAKARKAQSIVNEIGALQFLESDLVDIETSFRASELYVLIVNPPNFCGMPACRVFVPKLATVRVRSRRQVLALEIPELTSEIG